MAQRAYTLSRTETVRQRVEFTTDGNNVLSFAVQLEVETSKGWLWIRRYDTSNGEPHLDFRRADGTEEHHVQMNLSIKEALNVALDELERNWNKYCAWYYRGKK